MNKKLFAVFIIFLSISALADETETKKQTTDKGLTQETTWYQALFNFFITILVLVIFYKFLCFLRDWILGRQVDYLKEAQQTILKEALENCPSYLDDLYISRYAKPLGKIIGWSPDGMQLLEGKDREKVKGHKEIEIFVVAKDWSHRFPKRWFNFRSRKAVYIVPRVLRSEPLKGNIDIETRGFKEIGGFYFTYEEHSEKEASYWIKSRVDKEHVVEMQRRMGTQVATALDMNPKEISKVQLPDKDVDAGT